jgi:serine/threonine-protein kinase
MWADAMREIQDLLPNEDFVKPIPTSSPQDLSIVPNVVGMTVDDAKAILQNEGFDVTVAGQVPSDLPAGLVAQTSPASGEALYSGSTVALYTSTGSLAVPTPTPTAGAPPGGGNTGGGTGPGGGSSPTDGSTSSGPGNGHGNGHH